MEKKQVQKFNSNKVNVNLNGNILSKLVFALNEIEITKLANLIQNQNQNQNSNKSDRPNLNWQKNPNRLLYRQVQNVNLTTLICDMIKFQRPQRRKLYLKRFYGCKKPISIRDCFFFVQNINDAIKGH